MHGCVRLAEVNDEGDPAAAAGPDEGGQPPANPDRLPGDQQRPQQQPSQRLQGLQQELQPGQWQPEQPPLSRQTGDEGSQWFADLSQQQLLQWQQQNLLSLTQQPPVGVPVNDPLGWQAGSQEQDADAPHRTRSGRPFSAPAQSAPHRQQQPAARARSASPALKPSQFTASPAPRDPSPAPQQQQQETVAGPRRLPPHGPQAWQQESEQQMLQRIRDPGVQWSQAGSQQGADPAGPLQGASLPMPTYSSRSLMQPPLSSESGPGSAGADQLAQIMEQGRLMALYSQQQQQQQQGPLGRRSSLGANLPPPSPRMRFIPASAEAAVAPSGLRAPQQYPMPMQGVQQPGPFEFQPPAGVGPMPQAAMPMGPRGQFQAPLLRTRSAGQPPLPPSRFAEQATQRWHSDPQPTMQPGGPFAYPGGQYGQPGHMGGFDMSGMGPEPYPGQGQPPQDLPSRMRPPDVGLKRPLPYAQPEQVLELSVYLLAEEQQRRQFITSDQGT